MDKELFLSKKARVFVISSIPALRQVLGSVLKECGFENTLRFGSVREAAAELAGSTLPDWIITTTEAEEEVNAFHLLEYLIKKPELVNCRVSVALSEGDRKFLPAFFGFGLLSYMGGAGTSAAEYKAEIERFLLLVGEHHGNDNLIAYLYFMEYLWGITDYKKIERLSSDTMILFPNLYQVKLRFADFYMKRQDYNKGITLLRQVRADFPAASAEVDRMSLKYFGGENLEIAGEGSFAQTYDIEKVAVIDSDSAVLNTISSVMSGFGVSATVQFTDSSAFVDWLVAGNKPTLIIMEWRLPRLSGAAVVQRVRVEAKLTIPIIIYSSVVAEKDRLLLREMGVSDVISKPRYQKVLAEEIKQIIRNELTLANNASVEKQVQSRILARDISGAKILLERLKKGADALAPIRDRLEAKLYFIQNDFVMAERLALKALAAGGEGAELLDLLGRIYLKKFDYVKGSRYLERAAQMAPDNLDRICLMAETQLDTGEEAASDKLIDQARKIDPTSSPVEEFEALVAVRNEDSAVMQNVMANVLKKESVAIRLNNKAIYLINSNKISDGMKNYQKALELLSEDAEPYLLDTVYYNIGLAHTKLGNLEKATENLDKVRRDADPRRQMLNEKSKSLSFRIKASIKSGKPLRLNIVPASVDGEEGGNYSLLEMGDPPGSVAPTSKHTFPGKICLHWVYSVVLSNEPLQIVEMLKKPAHIFQIKP